MPPKPTVCTGIGGKLAAAWPPAVDAGAGSGCGMYPPLAPPAPPIAAGGCTCVCCVMYIGMPYPMVGPPDRAIVRHAAALGIAARALSDYGHPEAAGPLNGLVLGYGMADEGRIPELVGRLAAAAAAASQEGGA